MDAFSKVVFHFLVENWLEINKKIVNIFDDFSVFSILFTKKCKKKCLSIKMWTEVGMENT